MQGLYTSMSGKDRQMRGRRTKSVLPDLPRLASPMRLHKTLDLDEIEDNAISICPFYGQCLRYAAIKAWTAWSCKHCRIFLEEQERHTIEKNGEDSGKIGDIEYDTPANK
jgi:hypothetical protein